MADNLRESFSAFIDGEASEIEIHRLLRHIESDRPEESWVTYQQIRSVARGERTLPASRHEELRERIRAAVESEEIFLEAAAARRSLPGFVRPAAALGVAASLVAAVIVGFNMNTPMDEPSAIVDTAPPALETRSVALVPEPVADEELELRELDEETLRAVREYLNEHDRTVRMQPQTRTVIFEQPAGKQ